MVTVPRTAGFVPFERGDIEQSIGERFEQQVRRYPQRLALKGSGRRYTYKELNDCVNRIARRLIDECGEAEQTVGLLFEQGTDIIASILAVLKAGKIWVPLPAQGQQRTKAILDDVDAHCILTNSRHLQPARALSTPARRVIDVQDLPVNMSALNPGIKVSPDRLAHILFTSGSTGRPKGVYNNHRNVLHSIMTHTDALAITSRDRLSQLSPCHFLAGLTAMLRALLNGAAVLVYDLRESGIDRLGDWLRDERITIYQSVPTVFRELMAYTSRGQRFGSMRIVHLGGEEMLPTDVERFKQHFPSSCMLLHNLGSTEVSSYLQYFIAHDTLTPAQGVPAGYPVLDKQILLLDGRGHEVAPGEVGEIAVRSRYLALGYWGQSELTVERFREHGDSRIYRTGDLGQATREGCILYRGRKDGQVKIHGQRVELGEVEAALAAHPSVKQAVAALRSNRRGEPRLVAYYTVSRRDEISPGQWRGFLESHLPAYMIPQSFMRLRAFPRTDSGKVDRRKLPAVAVAGEEGQATGPSSSLEEVLCELWAELLGLEHADVDSDFFELGADSLLTMRLVAALRSARRLDVPVRAVFEHSTPRKLALYLDSLHEYDEGAQSRILCLPRSGPTPLSYAQARMWMDSQLEPNSPHNNVVMALRLYGSLDLQALRRSLAELWRRHEVLRSTFSLIGGRPMQTFLPPDEFTLRVDDLRPLATGVKAKEMLDQVRREAATPFDLEHGPLLRVRLLRLGAEDHALQFTLHHIVTDGWSMGLLREELGAIYNAFSKGRASPLTRLPLQYADYAHWQSRYLERDILQRELVYWRAQLGDARLTLDIPADHPRLRAISYRSAEQHCFDVDPALLAGLKTLSARQGVTLFMTLLSAFNVLLMRYTRQEDICVGTPIVGRRRREFEGLIGFFVNTLVMRIDLSGEPSFRELLGRVRETALQAYAHQELPFERLVEDLLLQRDSRGRSPIGVLFALQNTPRRPLELQGIRSERFVSMPLGGAAKERLYRTGDMVRYLADGAIDFIGRVDQQVKIRGFRIEIGEIESALQRHPGVNTTVVLCRSRNIGEKELIACCTANGESRLQAADIREHLKAWLPDYSVPAGIRILDSLPLTSNGKMDRQALANLALDDSSIEEPVQAESATESCLLDIWKRVLKKDNIGIDHDFFDIGGHSLLAISILIEVEQQLGKRLSIGLIFQNPTIRKLARMIDRPEPMDTQSAALLKENGSDAPFFCIHGNWHSLKDVLDESRPLYFLHHAHDKAMISYASVEDIAQTHVEHIQRVQSNGPYYIGGYSFGAVVAYEVARQLSAMGAEIESLVLIDPTKPRKAAGKFKDYKRLAHRLNNNLNRIEDTSNKLKHLKNGGLRFIDSKLRSLWINRKYKDLMCDTYRRIDKPLPPGLRKYYFSKLYKKAARAYAYPPYEGRISLFAPQARYLKGETIAEIASGWEKLARGGLDVHYVSGAAHHGDFFREPWMREFADKLNACLGG